MTFVVLYDDAFLDHRADGYHPERPERLVAFKTAFQRAGMWSDFEEIPAREATIEELCRVHDPGYVEKTLQRIDGRSGHLDPDTFFSPGSKKAALGAAGGSVDMVRKVWSRKAEQGLAMVRPPGHHAETRRACGFCIFNNVAIAAAALLEDGAERVLIFDPDVHHGNGTQQEFENDPRVFYISVHQWPHFPGTGLTHEIGHDKGKGFTANVPYPPGGADPDYREVVEGLVAPLARQYKPDMILLSVGLDALDVDPLAGMDLTRNGYAYMGKAMRDLADEVSQGRLAIFLEGGYAVDPASEALVDFVRAVRGMDDPKTPKGDPSQRHAAVLAETKENLREFWKL